MIQFRTKLAGLLMLSFLLFGFKPNCAAACAAEMASSNATKISESYDEASMPCHQEQSKKETSKPAQECSGMAKICCYPIVATQTAMLIEPSFFQIQAFNTGTSGSDLPFLPFEPPRFPA